MRRWCKRELGAVAEVWGIASRYQRFVTHGETEKTRELWERHRKEETQTHRLREPVGTPGETGVRRPYGPNPEAGDGAGPGSGGVTGNPVAESESEKRGRHVNKIAW